LGGTATCNQQKDRRQKNDVACPAATIFIRVFLNKIFHQNKSKFFYEHVKLTIKFAPNFTFGRLSGEQIIFASHEKKAAL
jgi:hypothetical protein